MSDTIREMLRSKPQVGVGICVALLALGLVVAWSTMGSSAASAPSVPAKLYFTDDDGKTYFADDSALVPPFDHNGKQAYQAAVFKCPGGQPFVGYLMTYSRSGKSQLEAMPESTRRSASVEVMNIRKGESLVRKPGDKVWASLAGDRPVGQILNPACPSGSGDRPEQIVP
jgi:hypothetical protein